MMANSGRYPIVPGSILRKKPMTQAIGAIGEGMAYPTMQLRWNQIYASYIDSTHFLSHPKLPNAVPVQKIRNAVAAGNRFLLIPLRVLPRKESPDFLMTSGALSFYVECKSSTIPNLGGNPRKLLDKISAGSAQIWGREQFQPTGFSFGIVLVSDHDGRDTFLHIGVVALG